MNKLFFGFLIFVNTSPISNWAYADWSEASVVLDVTNVTQQPHIAETLQYVKYFQDYLVSQDLASPSKLVMKSISAHVSYFKWSNDTDCQVPNPDKVPQQRLEDAKAAFYFADHPSDVKGVETITSLSSPCDGSKITRTVR